MRKSFQLSGVVLDFLPAARCFCFQFSQGEADFQVKYSQ